MSTRRSSRKRATRRAAAPPMTAGTMLVLLLLALVVVLMNRGVFDRWLLPAPLPPAATAPKGELPAPGGLPQGTLPPPQSIETGALAGYANGSVQVYFTRPRYPETAPTRTGGLDETIAAEIDRAAQSIDIATFDFDLSAIADALLRAHDRGLRVRLVVDAENLETPAVAALTGELQEAGIEVTFDRRDAFMHNKFIVVDSRVVWTGSWNLTINDTFRNNNNMLRFEDARIADSYNRKFALLIAGRGGPRNPATLGTPDVVLGDARVVTFFAPDSDVTSQVVRVIEEARSSIDFMAFTITSDPIADALIAAQGRGIAVRGVVERRNARATGSELSKLQSGGVDAREDGNCYIMHNKTFVVDGETVITGSFNWTRAAQESNDENVVIVDNGWLAARYAQEFERVYTQAITPSRC